MSTSPNDPSQIEFTVSNDSTDPLAPQEPDPRHHHQNSTLHDHFQQLRLSNIDINELNDPMAAFGVERHYTGDSTQQHGGISGQIQDWERRHDENGWNDGDGMDTFGGMNSGHIGGMDTTFGGSQQKQNQAPSTFGGAAPLDSSSHPSQTQLFRRGSEQSPSRSQSQIPLVTPSTKIHFTTTNTNPFTVSPETRDSLAQAQRNVQQNKRRFQNQSTNSATNYMHARQQGHAMGNSTSFTSDFHERRIQAERKARKWMDENIFDPIESTNTFQKLKDMGKKTTKKRGATDQRMRSSTAGPRTFGTSTTGWYRPSQYDRPFSRHEAFVESLVNKYIQFRDLGAGDTQRENQLASDIIDRVEKYTTGVRRNQSRLRGAQRGYTGAGGMAARRTTQRGQEDDDDFTLRPMQNAPTYVVTSRLENAVGPPAGRGEAMSSVPSLLCSSRPRKAPRRRIVVKGDEDKELDQSPSPQEEQFPPASRFLMSKL